MKRHLFLALLGLAGCAVGPDYQKPPAPTPAAFKEWKPGHPADGVNRGPWWSVFRDPVLDGLEDQVVISNQNLKQAEAAYAQARAVVDAARASFFPSLGLSGSGNRQGSQRSTLSRSGRGVVGNTFDASLGASWEPDIWGRIRRTVESDTASAEASAALLANARLSAQATLALDYFDLRIEDELKRLLDATVADYRASLQITQNQYAVGVARKADIVQAETQLKNTEAQDIAVGVLRAELEHAIAVLIGKPPADLSIAAQPLTVAIPETPPGVPTTLLERRPDIAAAERRMAAANAQIGIAVAAFYPTFTLSGSYGFTGSAVDTLFRASNSLWSFGAQASESLFDGGLRNAQVTQARAFYDEEVAAYRLTVLTGFQQIEDQLSTLRTLEQQAAVQAEAVQLAEEAVRLTINEYKAGTVPYTSVLIAQTTALGSEQTALNIRGSRLTAAVSLIEALGGGFQESDIRSQGSGGS